MLLGTSFPATPEALHSYVIFVNTFMFPQVTVCDAVARKGGLEPPTNGFGDRRSAAELLPHVQLSRPPQKTEPAPTCAVRAGS